MYIDRISSSQNPKIKELLLLIEKSRERREKGLFTVEGVREISNCIKSGYHLESLFFCEDLLSPRKELLEEAHSLYSVSRNVYSKIALRSSTEGAVAVFKEKKLQLDDIALSATPIVLILESVEKPGNLGAVLRTADAAGVDAVIICDPLTDLYNPNIIRASIGGIFSVQVAVCSSEDALQWLRKHHFTILSAQLQDSEPYYDVDMTCATAIVFGTESEGLSSFWRVSSDKKILIPMLGKLDSLNVSVSAAILSYEALRQRKQVK